MGKSAELVATLIRKKETHIIRCLAYVYCITANWEHSETCPVARAYFVYMYVYIVYESQLFAYAWLHGIITTNA